MSEPILIVEDEFFIAFEMKSILEDHGYEVAGIAVDMEGALAQAEKGAAVALVDLHLRDGFTGPQIGARLAEDYGITVLFVTANPRLLGKGIAGAVGVLCKPADSTMLLKGVEFALERRRGQSLEAPEGIAAFN